MYYEEGLFEKMHKAINIITCESKIPKNYGTEHKLTYSDICLLKCVQRNKNSKAGDLSKYLGMTNGAVAQLAKKLKNKGYLEPYRIPGNKKEVYYRLTEMGKKACDGYNKHYEKIKTCIESYTTTLDEETIKKIIGLFDIVVNTASVDKICSIKNTEQKNYEYYESKEDSIGRCEKCKRIY